MGEQEEEKEAEKMARHSQIERKKKYKHMQRKRKRKGKGKGKRQRKRKNQTKKKKLNEKKHLMLVCCEGAHQKECVMTDEKADFDFLWNVCGKQQEAKEENENRMKNM